MSKAKLQYLAAKASDNFLDDGIALTDSVTKLAKEHKLNPDEVARLCELSNLKAFDGATKKAAKNTVTFDLADINTVRKNLNMTDEPKTKTAAALEYQLSPDFLHSFNKTAAEIDVTDIKKRLLLQDRSFKQAAEHNKAIREKLAEKEVYKKLLAGKIGLQIKIASEHTAAVELIKHAALRNTNPFIAWPKINKERPELKEVTDSVFTKAAKALTNTWKIKIAELLTEVKQAKEKLDDAYDSLGKDGTSIVKKLDTISAYKKLYERVQNSVLKTNASEELAKSSILDDPKVKQIINNTSKIDID